MLKNKIFAILALVSLFIISFTSQNVSASSKKQSVGLVSMALVKDMMKPQFISMNYLSQQNDAHRSAKLKEIKAEQKRMEQEQNTSSGTTSSANKGSFKLSFYDPAAMGSSMGYGGVAANLSIFPKGTRLKITLSDGTVWHKIVNDTGSFAVSNPHQLDVAMPNNQVPAAGILYATVEVLG